MICLFHDWEYYGYVTVTRWLGGVSGGVRYQIVVEAEQCTKCDKIKTIE